MTLMTSWIPGISYVREEIYRFGYVLDNVMQLRHTRKPGNDPLLLAATGVSA